MPHDHPVKIMAESSGTHFDPDRVQVFLVYGEAFQTIARRYADA